MPSTVEELEGNRAKLAIEVPYAELKPALDKAYSAIAKQVNIPGFRAGKIPPALIDQRYGSGAVLQEALNEIIPSALGKALQEHELAILGQPEVDAVEEWEKGKPFLFTATVSKRPDFTLPDFTKIKVEVEPLDEKQLDVDGRIELLRERFATLKDVTRKAKKGDVVTVDLKGSRDGEALAEATAEGVTFKVGEGQMLEGLDKAVTGLKAGEAATFASTLVGGPLKGEQADIEVTLIKNQEQVLPELNDEFAQMVSEFDTVDEMKQDLAKAATQMAEIDQAVGARDKALEAIVEKIKMELPAEFVQGEIDARHEDIENQLSQAGMTLEKYLAEAEEGRSVEDFWTELDTRTKTALQAQLILDKVIAEKKPEITQADLSSYLMQRAQSNGSSPEQEMQHMIQHNHMQEWVVEIQRNKALSLICEDVQVKDTTGKVVDMTILTPKAPEMPMVVDGDEQAEWEADEADKADEK
ncbi:MAG: trigger factor [Propionibacteriaceae bacterium]